jgi:predicted Zn-dependent protease
MDCDRIRKRHIADEYRAGRLSPEETEAYERHYFTCDACFSDLRFHDRVASELKFAGAELFAPEIAAEMRPATQGPALETAPLWRRAKGWLAPRPVWTGGLAAAAAIAVIALLMIDSAQRAAHLRELWTPRPHPYIASDLRGPIALPEFQEAMQHYGAGRFEAAAERLRRAARETPLEVDVRFYLGVSLLLTGKPKEARRSLAVAAELQPSSTLFAWYLAQAHLACSRATEAEALLRRIAATQSEHAAAADSLLEKIAEARRR